jgi:heterodisulfide reductase subunit B
MSSELVPPGLSFLAENIASKQNILGASKEDGARWARELNLPAEAETVFFAGCGYQYSGQLESLMSLIRKMDKSVIGSELPMRLAGLPKKLGIDVAGIYGKLQPKGSGGEAKPLLAAVKVLRNLGIEPGYLAEEEPCCGASLYQTGLQKEFARNARQAYQKLKSRGAKRVISVVPYCTNALAKQFPMFIDDYDLEVKHFLEVVAEGISGRKLRFPRKVKVTYHDSCQLVRYLNLVEEPRRILNAIDGIELVEPDWTKGQFATCCGGGGGFEAVFPELSQVLAVNRTAELLETGADIIVTHCPGCAMQLEGGLKDLKVKNKTVMDITEVIATAMEG